MFIIQKSFDFSAGHHLEGLPADHQCARMHGHNYTLTITLASRELDQVGFVKDYGELDFVKDFINKFVEHQYLNNVVAFNPTAENLARWFYLNLVQQGLKGLLQSVEVKETAKTSATYVPDNEDDASETWGI